MSPASTRFAASLMVPNCALAAMPGSYLCETCHMRPGPSPYVAPGVAELACVIALPPMKNVSSSLTAVASRSYLHQHDPRSDRPLTSRSVSGSM